MTKILLPIDGSKHALRATRKLVELVQQWMERPEIVPMYVHLPVPRLPGMGAVVGTSSLQRYYKEEGEKALAPVERLLEKAGYKVQSHILVGPVAETIAAESKKRKCDLICIGTRGMTAAANLVMGSVATKLLHIAEVPVIVIR